MHLQPQGMGDQHRRHEAKSDNLKVSKAMPVAFIALDLVVMGMTLLHILMAPYTKVEESFNTQAMHDLLYHRHHLAKYDHLEFPGVVPRTFIGALAVTTLSFPVALVPMAWSLPKLFSLVIVRLVLGVLVLFSFYALRTQIGRIFGHQVSFVYTIITSLQFHLLFYASRPLPNIFALLIVNISYAFWIAGQPEFTLECLVFAATVFRCDVVLLLATIGVSLLLRKEISVARTIRRCFLVFILSLGTTVVVDSVMWRRWLWPEFEVFWFNSILNKSSAWGVSPVHWYFTSALPRAMLGAYPLLFLGLVLDRRLSQYVIPVLAFILLYSKLAHKELRFILFTVPMLNLSSAVALARIYNNRRKPVWAFLFTGCILLLLTSASITVVMSRASHLNYPGGKALGLLHVMDALSGHHQPTVHVDVYPAMTGVSRFCEMGPPWSYSKEEGLTVTDLSSRNYTYLISEHPSIPGFDCLMAIEGFSGIALHASVFPLKLIMEHKVFLHKNEKIVMIEEKWPGCGS